MPPGIEPFKQFFSGMLAAFPDFHMTINDMLADGDKVVTYKTGRATNTGEFMGMPATGKAVEFDVIGAPGAVGNAPVPVHRSRQDALSAIDDSHSC
jgi:predicted ester cyclase